MKIVVLASVLALLVTPVAAEQPVKDTHQKRVYLSASEVKGYVAGHTFSEIGPVGGRQRIYKYGKDDTCLFPRPDPLRGQYFTDRACKYTVKDRGILCHTFSDGGAQRCVRMTIFEHGSDTFYAEHPTEGWIQVYLDRIE